MKSEKGGKRDVREVGIDVVEPGECAREGRIKVDMGSNFSFSTERLESYAFATWKPVIFDAMVVAAAVEYSDKLIIRPASGWTRKISIRIPVHNPEQWAAPDVSSTLIDALEFLTGDYWDFEFIRRSASAPEPSQKHLFKLLNTKAVLAYSDGMDSRAVAEILKETYDNKLVRVRVGPKKMDKHYEEVKNKTPFTTVPYKISCSKINKESSARSRGFKFSLITSIAAYLAEAEEIIIPESGQGAIGPALVIVGHGYPDYRNHPLFARRMERFINALFGTKIRFCFPRIWHTKGETLREMVSASNENDWKTTRSCWQGNNMCSIGGKLRQCGICAACMLRRVSVHAAGLVEDPDIYVTSDMRAKSFTEAIDKNFTRRNSKAFYEYAIGGVLHMDNLADMAEPDSAKIVRRHALLIAPALDISHEDAEKSLKNLLQKHTDEWRNYLESLGAQSFVRQWLQVEK